MTTDMAQPRRVFVSYHQKDFKGAGFLTGRATQFATYLREFIEMDTTLGFDPVYIDEEARSTDLAWLGCPTRYRHHEM